MFLHLQKGHKGGGKAHSWLPHHPFLQVYRDQLILKCVRRKGWKDTKDSYIRKKNYSAYQQQNHASSFLTSQRAQPCRNLKAATIFQHHEHTKCSKSTGRVPAVPSYRAELPCSAPFHRQQFSLQMDFSLLKGF